jgi:hypothetical protein
LSKPRKLKGAWYLTQIDWNLVNKHSPGPTPPMDSGGWDLYEKF